MVEISQVRVNVKNNKIKQFREESAMEIKLVPLELYPIVPSEEKRGARFKFSHQPAFERSL